MKGKVYLVGAGPGKADLITVRGLQILRQADVIIHDYLVDRRILKEAKTGAELIPCSSLGKMRYKAESLKAQKRINDLMVKKAKAGKNIARLKNGDPMIFSRCAEELEALADEAIEFEIVPAVTAASAASAFTGIPLTSRGVASSVVFVTGHRHQGRTIDTVDWQAIAKIDTIVLYMAGRNLDHIAKKLIDAGRDKNTPVAVVQGATDASQKVITATLGAAAKKAKGSGLTPPLVIIIGETVRFEKRFNWVRKNRNILFTGLSAERHFLKGNYHHIPLIEISPMEDYKNFDRHIKDIRTFDWIVFASRYGVKYFFDRLFSGGLDSRALKGIKIACVGQSTRRRLVDYGVIADLVPEKESSRGLLEAFKDTDINGKRVFLPRSDISDKGLEKGLEKLGAAVSTAYAYHNVMPRGLPPFDIGLFDEIVFTSPSTVRNFKRLRKKLPKDMKIRCIGDVTSRELKRCLGSIF